MISTCEVVNIMLFFLDDDFCANKLNRSIGLSGSDRSDERYPVDQEMVPKPFTRDF